MAERNVHRSQGLGQATYCIYTHYIIKTTTAANTLVNVSGFLAHCSSPSCPVNTESRVGLPLIAKAPRIVEPDI